jgi:hypothetical protein
MSSGVVQLERVDVPLGSPQNPLNPHAKMQLAGIINILSLELPMEILFAPWLPPVLLGLGIYMLLKTHGVGLKIIGGLLAFVGGLLTVFEIWIHTTHYHR